ncbi:cyclin-O protein B-like [Xenopus laevis]|uniref:Cyclin-O protein B-like n=1 Tax=Xenopus laevis TaxID=8355 RepID=A0A8J1LZL5_XENLA|nr:cyclin-O protein B-like [Xenopus laevis]XP_041434491.1 cyclin-O protein B-like [Xenopus laevis]XP_041434501.1 cyclin-O protein B-like [Xenopus laevis]XP_041434503.1 cyclin-O protein B-like [Xenopus laevis]XP_041434508.1 cyclin-O protein B-like [Xenopus laevis]
MSMETSKARKRRRQIDGEQLVSPGCRRDTKRVRHQGDQRGTCHPSAGDPALQNEPWNTLAHIGIGLETFKEYGEDAYLHDKSLEERFMALNFLQSQPEITTASWNVFTGLLICVHRHQKLDFRSLCLTVNLLERFLACAAPIKTTDLNRVGATCFNIACKLVETKKLRKSNRLKLFDDTFTKKEMNQLERTIICKLLFQLAAPTIDDFLEYFTLRKKPSAVQLTKEAIALTAARGIAALSLTHHHEFCIYAPSMMALCCLKVATKFHPSGKPINVDPAEYPDHVMEECVGKIFALISSRQSFLHKLLPAVFPKTLPPLPGNERPLPASHEVDTSSGSSRTPRQETEACTSRQEPKGGETATSGEAPSSNHLEMAQGSDLSNYHQGVTFQNTYIPSYYQPYMHPYIPTYPYCQPNMYPYIPTNPYCQPNMYPYIPTNPYCQPNMYPYIPTYPYCQPNLYPYIPTYPGWQPYMHTDTHPLTDTHTDTHLPTYTE